MQFDADEIERVNRITYARWLGVPPREWDAMSYPEQCDVMEIARAQQAIERYDAARLRQGKRR